MNAAERLKLQDGVISRRQALADGLSVTEIKRLVRRREWTTMRPGVYVDHTGEPTWRQCAWAAVLACGPGAALCLDSVAKILQRHGWTGEPTQCDACRSAA